MLTILITDDDVGDRKQIKRALRQSGLVCEVTEAANVTEALSACDRAKFDCAIFDYHMPKLNGLDGIDAFRLKMPYTALLMVTGQGDELIASEAIKRGASEYIPKGFVSAETIRRMIENALEKTELRQKLDEQQHALENFANVLAHDLKAPIRQIRKFGKLMAEAIDTNNFEELEDVHFRMDRAGKRLENLIDTLNEYNKATGGWVPFEAVSMEDVLCHATEGLSLVIEERGAAITHDVLPEIYGNAPQLIQLLQNLFGNAIKYCDRPVPQIHVSATYLADGWQLCVQDNGIGIPKAYYKMIFDPFKRLNLPGHRKYAGTGLGLATCKKIVERHGGKIWCESEEGKGTAFFFTLPSVPNTALANPADFRERDRRIR